MGILVKILQRQRFLYINNRFIYFKELGHAVTEADKSELGRMENQGRIDIGVQSSGPSAGRFLSCSAFCSIHAFSWLDKAYLHYEGASLVAQW